MSQDIVADALSMIQNAKKAGKENVKIQRISTLLTEVLKIMKHKKAIKRYKMNLNQKYIEVEIGDLLECKSIKPRFTVKKDQIEKYRRRYLPARNVGTLIISTPKGLVTHKEALEEEIGGVLIAYFY